MSNLLDYAESELRRAGMYNDDADYGAGEIAGEVLKIVRAFDSGEHTGASMMMTLGIVNELVRFKPLSPLTSSPDEWMEIQNELWQSRRAPTCFSNDGGKTFYDIDEKDRPIHTSAEPKAAA